MSSRASQDLPVLYSFRRCPYAMRARLALQVSGQSYRLREIRLSARPQELYDLSPKGTVPVLQLPGGSVIDESLAIMHWALEREDPLHWLPTNGEQTATTSILLAGLDTDFKPNLDRYKYADRYPGAVSLEHRAAACEFLFKLESILAHSPFLFGESAQLADMALAPFVRQFAMADKPWFDEQPWTGLNNWLERFLRSPLFAAIMPKRDVWVPGEADLLVTP